MSNILSKIYSTGDSWRRALVDVLTNPADVASQAIGGMQDSMRAVKRDFKDATTDSVLVPFEQKDKAWKRASDAVQVMLLDLLPMNPGSKAQTAKNIIVPVEAAFPKMKRGDIADLVREIDIDPSRAYEMAGAYRQPLTGKAVVNVSDVGQQMKLGTVLPVPNMKYAALRARPGNPYRVDELIDISRYPADLQEYFRSLTVRAIPGAGASFSASKGTIGLGEAANEKELTSNLLHELQHGAQYLYDMPRGGNPQAFFADYGKFSTAKMRAEQLLEDMERQGIRPQGMISPDFQAANALRDPDTVNTINGMLAKVNKQAHRNYENIAGEVEARLVQELFRSDTQELPTRVMRETMRVSPSQILDPAVVPDVPKVDADPVTQSLIRILLGEQP